MDYLELTAPQLNQAIAERIFGAKLTHSPFHDNVVFCDFPNRVIGQASQEVPNFCGDWNMAILLRDKVFEWGYHRRKLFTDRIQQLVTAEYPEAFPEPEKFLIHESEILMRVASIHLCVAALEVWAVKL